MSSMLNNNKKSIILFEILNNYKLIWKLAKNDFKTKYAGSYLGIIWAFIQPIVTVFVYWFVFQIALPSQPVENVPYVLWLIAGLVPWFFFSDAWSGGTSSFLEYSYLVKKVVFKISILPVVKVTSALFTHIAFIIFLLIVYIIYGNGFDLYLFQIFYFSIALYLFVLALSYIFSAALVFFRDLSQIVAILLQVGIWVTPILWNIDNTNMPLMVKNILMLNPLFYIINGYRDSIIYKQWFFEDIGMTLYFWSFTIILYLIGTWMFKKLKIHFADVL